MTDYIDAKIVLLIVQFKIGAMMRNKIIIFTTLLIMSAMPTWAAEVRLSFVEGHTSIEDREVNPNVITNQNKHVKRWVTSLKADEMKQLIVGVSIGNKCTADSAGSSLPGSYIRNNSITVTSDKPYMVRGHRLIDGVKGKVCIRHPSFKGVNTEFRAGDSVTVTLYRK